MTGSTDKHLTAPGARVADVARTVWRAVVGGSRRQDARPTVESGMPSPNTPQNAGSGVEDDVAELVERMRQKYQVDQRRIENASERIAIEEREKIVKAERFVQDTGLGKSLLEFWDIVQCYPDWSTRPTWNANEASGNDWYSSNPLGVENVRGKSFISVSFLWKDREYTVRAANEEHDDRDIEYWSDNRVVLSIRMTGPYVISGVRALALGNGSWVASLLEFNQAFELEKTRCEARQKAKAIRDIAARIEL